MAEISDNQIEMKTIEEKAKEAWEDYCYTANGNLYRSVFQDGYKQGADEAMRQPWTRWTDRKPEEDEPIIAIEIIRDWQGYHILHMGDANIGIIEMLASFGLGNIYWLPLPQRGKEKDK